MKVNYPYVISIQRTPQGSLRNIAAFEFTCSAIVTSDDSNFRLSFFPEQDNRYNVIFTES